MNNISENSMIDLAIFDLENLKYFLENSSIHSIKTVTLKLLPYQKDPNIYICEFNNISQHQFFINSSTLVEQFFNSEESYQSYLFQSKIKPQDLKLLNSFFSINAKVTITTKH